MEFLPSADFPQLRILTMGAGTDSKTMESEVTVPIERAVNGLNGKTNIFSRTGDGYSTIDLYYEAGYDMMLAKQEVQDALSKVSLPPNVSNPMILQMNTSMIPIVNIAVTFEEGLTEENIEFARDELHAHFQGIKGVSEVNITGASDSVISINIDNEKLAQNQIPFEAVLGILNGQNTAIAIGEKIIDGKTSNIKVIGELNSLEKLKELPVMPNVLLGDIATIEETTNEGNYMSRFNGKEYLDIMIMKEDNANAVAVSKEVYKVVEEINEKYKQQESIIYVASTDMVEGSVHTMIKEVLLGALFATIVIMLFLRNIRTTFITIVSIPLSLCLTLFLLSISGVTLNILTLGGVAVAVGRLVDDSIVVIENIFRKKPDAA